MILNLAFSKLLFLQIMIGAIAYAVAKQSAAVFLVVIALGVLSRLMAKKHDSAVLPRWLVNVAVALAALWTIREKSYADTPLIIVLADFMLNIQLIKLFDRKTNRDHAMQIVLSLMLVTCASIISASIFFGLLLITYMIIALFTVLKFQLKSGLDYVQRQIQLGIPQNHTPIPIIHQPQPSEGKQFNRIAIACALGCTAFSTIFFIAMPRGQGRGILGNWSPQTIQLTGYDSNVELRSGNVSTSSIPAMHVKAKINGQPAGSGLSEVRLRGMALDTYNAKARRWDRSPDANRSRRYFDMRDRQTVRFLNQPPPGDVLELNVSVRVNTKGALFASNAPLMIRIENHKGIRFNPLDQHLARVRDANGTANYTIWCSNEPRNLNERYFKQWQNLFRERLPADQRRQKGSKTTNPQATYDKRWSKYARNPVLKDPRIEELALQIISEAKLSRPPEAQSHPNDHPIAKAIENHLQKRCAYTLDLPQRGRDEPITSFLFDKQEGHCQYFASAMAALLRSLHIRTRVVTGFVSNEYNEVGDYYIVRQKHAHAWVEVWSDRTGWKAFDPSPPAAIEQLHDPGSGFFAALTKLYDYVEFQWLSNIVAYDATQRQNIFASIKSALDAISAVAQEYARQIQQFLKSIAPSWSTPSITGTFLGVIILVALIGLFFVARRYFKSHASAKQLQLRNLPANQRKQLAQQLQFYLDMLAVIQKLGHTKSHHQTPGAFAEQLNQLNPHTFSPTIPLTNLYYAVRFGQKPLTSNDQQQVRSLLQQLSQATQPHFNPKHSLSTSAV